jgi:tRNA pseudouridine32 synthase/23S rRNA pseudouridine746 synthase
MAIVGDPVYGNPGEPMLLHSAFLSLPRQGKQAIEAIAPLPQRFINAGFSPLT